MNPIWKKDGEQFEDDLEEWERQIDEYERDSTEEFPDTHKKAILMHNAPGQIKKHLYLNSSRMTSFAVVKHEVIQFLRSERSFENRTRRDRDRTHKKEDPMDIDEIGKGKKGKNKCGRGKGGKMQHFNSWNARWNKSSKGKQGSWSKGGKGKANHHVST